MAKLGSTRTARARQMRRVLQRWERSGLTLKAFGEREGIAVSTLAWWRHLFRHAERPRRPRRVTGIARSHRGDAAQFVEVQRPAPVAPHPSVIEILLRSGHVLRVPVGVEVGAVRMVVSALEVTC